MCTVFVMDTCNSSSFPEYKLNACLHFLPPHEQSSQLWETRQLCLFTLFCDRQEDAYIVLLPEELPIVGGADPVLVLQVLHWDGEVGLRG